MRAFFIASLILLNSQSIIHAQDRIPESQTFQLAPGLSSFYQVGRVDADETLKLKHLGPVNFGFRKAPMLTEGHFIGVGSENPGLFATGSHFFRVQVKSVLAGGNLEAKIEKAAVAHFENMNIVGLFRPLGSTTRTIQAAPPYAAVFDVSEEIPGMDKPQQQQLAECRRRMKQIGLAFHNFHEANQQFPPAVVYGPDGKPWHSWRVLLLPYLDQQELYDQYKFNEPWNGPNNRKLLKKVPDVYRNPIYAKPGESETHFATVTTKTREYRKRSAFNLIGGRFNGKAADLPTAIKAGSRFRDIVDGTSHTVLVGTIAPSQAIPWLKPADVPYDTNFKGLGPKTFDTPFSTKAAKAGLFLRADGSVKTVRADISADLLRRLFIIGDGEFMGPVPSLEPPGRRVRGSVPTLEIVKGKDGPVAKLRYVVLPPIRRAGSGSAEGSSSEGDSGGEDRP